VDTDRYGRTVAKVFVNGRDINREMVGEGHARVYRNYLRDPTLPDYERKATGAELALWALPEAETAARLALGFVLFGLWGREVLGLRAARPGLPPA